MKQIYLYPGQWAFSTEPAEISTILGSCVGIALHDYKLKTGALNHYLLADAPPHDAPSTRYGSVAIPMIVEEMLKNGSDRKSLQAKVYGGGNVLNGVTIGEGIGNKNVAYALKVLEEYRIPILEQNVGGVHGRKISLNTHTFEVSHRTQGSEGGKKSVDIGRYPVLDAKKEVKVAIVDDSATVRSLFQKIFQKSGIEVVGTAANAYEARELIVRTKPDVITLDLEMPLMNGVEFLEKLMMHMPMPVVVVSSLGNQGEAAMRTLQLGAIEFVHKPSQFDPMILRQLGETLVEKVRAAACMEVAKLEKQEAAKIRPLKATSAGQTTRHHAGELKIVGIGGNAGSTESLRKVLEGLPSDTPPVLVANGTIAAFVETYSAQLKKRVQVQLNVAQEGAPLRMGNVYFAPEGMQMRVVSKSGHLSLSLNREAPVCGQVPSSNVLFESIAQVAGSTAAAVLLGGFGSDGVEGLRKVQAQGGMTFAEDPASAGFPFAPQQAIEIGVVDRVSAAEDICNIIIELRNRKVAV